MMIKREFSIFPEDKTGDLLWQLLNQGCDLNATYEIEFSMIFPSEQQALAFGHLLLANNQKISFSPFETHKSHPWEITAYPNMPLSYQNIIGYQQLLISNATAFAGIFDGWYCPVAAETQY